MGKPDFHASLDVNFIPGHIYPHLRRKNRTQRGVETLTFQTISFKGMVVSNDASMSVRFEKWTKSHTPRHKFDQSGCRDLPRFS
jgi:hypothetical protein